MRIILKSFTHAQNIEKVPRILPIPYVILVVILILLNLSCLCIESLVIGEHIFTHLAKPIPPSPSPAPARGGGRGGGGVLRPLPPPPPPINLRQLFALSLRRGPGKYAAHSCLPPHSEEACTVL